MTGSRGIDLWWDFGRTGLWGVYFAFLSARFVIAVVLDLCTPNRVSFTYLRFFTLLFIYDVVLIFS